MNAYKRWISNIEDLQDFLSYVIIYAPDDFPKEDYLSDEEQMNLERAFTELNNSIFILSNHIHDDDIVEELTSLLSDALIAYREGDDIRGSHLLQLFERRLPK